MSPTIDKANEMFRALSSELATTRLDRQLQQGLEQGIANVTVVLCTPQARQLCDGAHSS